MSYNIKKNELSNGMKKRIYAGFSEQAIEATGINGLSEEPISCEIYDDKNFVGAVVVQIFWGQLHIKFLFVEKKYRGQGIARQLMNHAFEFGKKRGCQFSFVETMSFQAPEFYRKMGFVIDFSRPGYAENTTFHYMKKSLDLSVEIISNSFIGTVGRPVKNKITPDFSIKVDNDITLNLPTVEEAAELFSLVDKNRDYLREFLGWLDNSKEVADTRKFIEVNLPSWLQLNSLLLSIRKDHALVGAVGLHQIDFVNKSAFMGYWLDEAHQGQGIMKKSVSALVNYGFNDLKLHRMQILCAINNTRSQNIALSLGFEKEGILKDAIHHYGSYLDAYLYAKVASKLNN